MQIPTFSCLINNRITSKIIYFRLYWCFWVLFVVVKNIIKFCILDLCTSCKTSTFRTKLFFASCYWIVKWSWYSIFFPRIITLRIRTLLCVLLSILCRLWSCSIIWIAITFLCSWCFLFRNITNRRTRFICWFWFSFLVLV